MKSSSTGPGYASPLEAMKGPRENLMYVALVSCDTKKPDALATVDLDSGKVIHTLEMPFLGDELHHFGWNACSSCCNDKTKQRRFLILPGQISSRIYIVDTVEPRSPKIHKVIAPEVIKDTQNLTAPHTVHCLPNGQVMVSFLGDKDLKAPGGFLLLDAEFNMAGRWSAEEFKMHFNHDFWYQPAHNVMVSSEFAAPKDYYYGFKAKDLDKFGHGLNFWNWRERTLIKHADLGNDGKLLLAARFLHNPKSTDGFVVSAIGNSIWRWYLDTAGAWQVELVSQLEGVKRPGWTMPVPIMNGDSIISLDDHWLYVSSWLNGDLRQYDVSNPSKPRLAGRVWFSEGYTAAGKDQVRASRAEFRAVEGGPHMMQLSLDGKRLYVTNSFLSSWDDQFYPDIGKNGSRMLRINCDTEKGGMEIDESFMVSFANLNGNKYRAHEMRYPGGDCTSDIWL